MNILDNLQVVSAFIPRADVMPQHEQHLAINVA